MKKLRPTRLAARHAGRPAPHRVTGPARGRRIAAAACLALGAVLLAACGQKGPLWVTGHGKDTPWPMQPAGADATPPAGAPPAAAPTAAPPAATPPTATSPAATSPVTTGGAANPPDATAKTPQDAR